jgi:hypothetical protein
MLKQRAKEQRPSGAEKVPEGRCFLALPFTAGRAVPDAAQIFIEYQAAPMLVDISQRRPHSSIPANGRFHSTPLWRPLQG